VRYRAPVRECYVPVDGVQRAECSGWAVSVIEATTKAARSESLAVSLFAHGRRDLPFYGA
jgi:hypothetical protein